MDDSADSIKALPSPLLRLPTELRIEIYRHVFAGQRLRLHLKDADDFNEARSPSFASLTEGDHAQGCRSIMKPTHMVELYDTHTQLLQTCRWICREALPVLKATSLHLLLCEDVGAPYKPITFTRQILPNSIIKRITKVKLHYNFENFEYLSRLPNLESVTLDYWMPPPDQMTEKLSKNGKALHNIHTIWQHFRRDPYVNHRYERIMAATQDHATSVRLLFEARIDNGCRGLAKHWLVSKAYVHLQHLLTPPLGYCVRYEGE